MVAQPQDSEGSGDRLSPELYAELRAIAGSLFEDERANHTLQPTALVHEVWLRLGGDERTPEDRRAFLALAAHGMRNALVDHARRRNALKRGSGREAVTLVESVLEEGEAEVELLDLDAALERLGERDPELARVVELRTFGGLTLAETASATGMSFKQVRNAWDLARAFLKRELRSGE